MRRRASLSTLVLPVIAMALILLASCAPPERPANGDASSPATRSAGKTLVMISAAELPTFSDKQMLPSGAAVTIRSSGQEILNAKLSFRDERGLPFPVLAETLPEIDAGTWRVFPDGKMETVYQLRAGLTWHDQEPIRAEDFVFAWRMYANPAFGVSETGGFRYLEGVTALDPRTLVLRWKQPYPEAVEDVDVLPPLPAHILEQTHGHVDADQFMTLPFWRDEYVGTGPFRLERREPGVFFEATAFDGFALGRPRIDRVRIIYIPSSTTIVANLLSGEAHFSMEGNLYGEDGLSIERQWGPNGTVTFEPLSPRAMEFQARPEVRRSAAAGGRRARATSAGLRDGPRGAARGRHCRERAAPRRLHTPVFRLLRRGEPRGEHEIPARSAPRPATARRGGLHPRQRWLLDDRSRRAIHTRTVVHRRGQQRT